MNSNQFYCNNASNCHFNYSGTGATYVGNAAGTNLGGVVTGGTYNSQTISNAASFTGSLTTATNVSVGGNLDIVGGNITSANVLTSDTDATLPHLVLDSSSAGDNWTSQGAYISIGESGDLGSASMHLTYTGDGFGYSGAGTVTAGIPAGGYWRYTYNAQSIYTPSNITAGTYNSQTISSTASLTGTLTIAGALTQNGAFTMGDNGDTGSVNTSDWDISTTGGMTGIGAITADGQLTLSGSAANISLGSNYLSGDGNHEGSQR